MSLPETIQVQIITTTHSCSPMFCWSTVRVTTQGGQGEVPTSLLSAVASWHGGIIDQKGKAGSGTNAVVPRSPEGCPDTVSRPKAKRLSQTLFHLGWHQKVSLTVYLCVSSNLKYCGFNKACPLVDARFSQFNSQDWPSYRPISLEKGTLKFGGENGLK